MNISAAGLKASDIPYRYPYFTAGVEALDDLTAPYAPVMSGTIVTPAQLIDGNTGVNQQFFTAGLYADMTMTGPFVGLFVRLFWGSGMTGDGTILIQLKDKDGNFNTVLTLTTGAAADWSAWTAIAGSYIADGAVMRLLCGTVDTLGQNRVRELEAVGFLLYRGLP